MDYEKMCANLHALLRKSTIALMLLTALCAVSCKTTKTATKSALSVQTDQKNNLDQHTTSQTDVQLSCQSSDTGNTTTHVDEVIEETTWSAPDSTGAQYPIKTTKTTRQTHTDKQNNIQTNQENNTSTVTESDTKDKSQTTTHIEDQKEAKTTTKTKTPAWIIVLIVGVLAIVAIVVLLILKRYKII